MTEVKPSSPESEFLRVRRAAQYLDCSEWSIWKKLTSGELKRYKLGGHGLTYVKRSELDALIRETQ
jgi:excisionase family DNA binding protein